MAEAVKKRTAVKTVTVSVENTTVDDFSDVAKLVGAPSDARISTGGAVFNPANGETDNLYPYSVTFNWTEEV